MIYLNLFLGFLKVGCFTFGGGYAAIPLIRDMVLDYGWLTEDRITYMIAVSESTPGPIMVNMATYVGSSQAGFLGAALATLAVVLPSFCIILTIMLLLKSVLQNPNVKAVLAGMQPCVIGIILATGAVMTVHSCFSTGAPDIRSCMIALILGGLVLFGKKLPKHQFTPIQLILLSAVLGIVFYGVGS